MSVDEYAEAADAFLDDEQHPTLGRQIPRHCGTCRWCELLGYLEANGFATYIASGGDRDFMRPVTRRIYDIPAQRVVGSATGLRYLEDEQGGNVVYEAAMDVFDDGPIKPVRIWSRIGRRPLIAVGNSNGDIEMLQYAGGRSRPPFGCWSSTTTTSASSRTRQAPSGPSSRRRRRAGRSSASRTTGAPSSPTSSGT